MRILLLPFSIIFYVIVYIRNKLYSLGVLRAMGLNTLVISVGNIAPGGTGKTPLVEYLARYFIGKNKQVVIICKGYKRTYDDIQVAELGYNNSDKKLNTENFGDESMMLLENFKGESGGKGLLIVSDDKTVGAKFAYKKFKPDIMIIDDGFQHRKLFRDLDIVMVDNNTKGFVLPAGNLREPLRNLKRADIIIINHKFGQAGFQYSKNIRYRLDECHYELNAFLNIDDIKLKDGPYKVLGFCGIGDPESFRYLIGSGGNQIIDFIAFPDHHNYKAEDLKKLIKLFEEKRPDVILTTQKDFIRLSCASQDSSGISDLRKKFLSDYPLYYAKIKLQISENSTNLINKLKELTRERQTV